MAAASGGRGAVAVVRLRLGRGGEGNLLVLAEDVEFAGGEAEL